MNLAALLPRFAQTGFLSRQAQLAVQAASVAQTAPHTLARHAILQLDNQPLQLHVLRGCVWITRDGCAADVVLDAGAVFEQRPGARVLVQALEDAELLIAGKAWRTQNA